MADFVATPIGFAILLVVAWLVTPFLSRAHPATRFARLAIRLVVLAAAVRMFLHAYGAARPGGTPVGTTLTLVGGTIGGALLGPLLVLVVMVTFYKVPGPENWDFATPMLSIAAMVVAAIVGALAGLAATRYFLEGRPLAGSIAVAVATLLVASMPVGILSLKHLPPPKPANARKRARWARRTRFWARIRGGRGWEETGAGLAHSLRRMIGEPSPTPLAASIITQQGHEWRKTWLGLDVEARAALFQYRQDDLGWRWDVASESPPRIVVVPDPLLGLPGPVFEVRPHRILRRAHRDAPGFALDAALPTVATARRYLLAFAGEAARDGRWDGTALGLRSLFAACFTYDRTGARPHSWLGREPRADGVWTFHTSVRGAWAGAQVIDVEVRPAARAGAAPCDMAFTWLGVGYLVDADGGWHMREGAPATPDDPPPPPCLLDLAVPCD